MGRSKKRIELIIAVALVPLDYAMIILAGWSAYNLRFGDTVQGLKAAIYVLPSADFWKIALSVGAAMILVFAFNRMYAITGTRRIIDELRKVVLACSTGIMIIIVLFFFNRDFFSSRFIIVAAWLIAMLYVFVMRLGVIVLERWLFKRGIGVHRVLLIGSSQTASILYDAFQLSPVLGFQVVERTEQLNDDVFDKIQKIIRVKAIDDVIVTDQELSRKHIAQLIEFCNIHHLDFKYAADIFDAQVSHISIRPVAGIPLVELRRTPLQGWGRITKRAVDIVLSALALVVSSPLLLVTALVVRLDSAGPIIYRNRRVGENGKEFDTLKFRSMKQEYSIGSQFAHTAEALKFEQQLIQSNSIKEGPIYKIKDDPRVTRVGKFIRRFSLDEFPQFYNVLKGDMSLVGPRPHQPREVAGYADAHKVILSMKPGVTGLAQISGRSDLEFSEEMRLDTYYMENWSLLLDLYILFKTPFTLLSKRKAL